jgi:hypothetical protein
VELRDLDRQIERASARLKNVTAAMAAAGFSEALLAQLKIEEQAVAALKARRATAAKDSSRECPAELVQSAVLRSLSFSVENSTTEGRAVRENASEDAAFSAALYAPIRDRTAITLSPARS